MARCPIKNAECKEDCAWRVRVGLAGGGEDACAVALMSMVLADGNPELSLIVPGLGCGPGDAAPEAAELRAENARLLLAAARYRAILEDNGLLPDGPGDES